jgi:hypothetical protein
VILPAIRVIMCGAFEYCSGLTAVILGKGLGEIGRMAFQECTLLREIVIPPSIRAIMERAFYRCLGLIRKKAFASCRLLCEIVIPPAVRVIK